MRSMNGNRKYKNKSVGETLIFIAAILFFIGCGLILYGLDEGIVTALCCALIAAPFLVVSYLLEEKGSAMVKHTTDRNMAVLEPFLNKEFPGYIYSPNGEGADSNIYVNVLHYPDICWAICSEYFSADKDNNSFEYSHICICKEGTDDGDVTLFNGNVFTFTGDRSVPGVVRIISTRKNAVGKEKHHFPKFDPYTEVRIESTNDVFNSIFEIYASDLNTGHYVLNATAVERLMEFRKKYDNFCIAVQGADIHVAVRDSQDLIHSMIVVEKIGSDEVFRDFSNKLYGILDDVKELQHALSLHI